MTISAIFQFLIVYLIVTMLNALALTNFDWESVKISWEANFNRKWERDFLIVLFFPPFGWLMFSIILFKNMRQKIKS